MYHTRLIVRCDPAFSEILLAEIAQAGFDTFLENEEGFEAYADGQKYDRPAVEHLKLKYGQVDPLSFTWERVEQKNWNEEWERSYDPIVVDNKCLIKAAFHKIDKQYPYEVTITPKMSFGTGHHQTTYLMVKAQMAIDHQDKIVMDAGCGTAILSIMASKLGALKVDAFDIDEWSVINGQENVQVNHCQNIQIRQGKINDLDFADGFDIILANINKNVLLYEIPQYAAYLNSKGYLLLSGFYEEDIPDLIARAATYHLLPAAQDVRERWACLLLQENRMAVYP